MLRFAEFLGRRGRRHVGLGWADRSIERYGEKEDNLVAALVLLSGAKPPPADRDEAMRRIADNRSLLVTYSGGWVLCDQIEKLGLQDRFLAQIDQDWMKANNGLRVQVGIMLMVTGHPAEAIDYLDRDRMTRFVTRDDAKGLVSALQTLAARLAKRPDLAVAPAALRKFIGQEHFIPTIDPLLRYLAGDSAREAALADAGKDADELVYYLGIDAAAHGDLDQARKDLGQVIDGHPDWSLSGDARRMLQWIDSGMTIAPALVPAGGTKVDL
jgi:hypothetical protein